MNWYQKLKTKSMFGASTKKMLNTNGKSLSSHIWYNSFLGLYLSNHLNVLMAGFIQWGWGSISLLSCFPHNSLASTGCVLRILVIAWNVSSVLLMYLEDQVKLSQQWLLLYCQVVQCLCYKAMINTWFSVKLY